MNESKLTWHERPDGSGIAEVPISSQGVSLFLELPSKNAFAHAQLVMQAVYNEGFIHGLSIGKKEIQGIVDFVSAANETSEKKVGG